MRVAHIQEVNYTIPDGTSVDYTDLDPAFTDFSRLVVFSNSWKIPPSDLNSEALVYVSGLLVDLGGGAFRLTLRRAGFSGDCVGTAYVVQFASDVNVYKGSVTLAAGDSGPQSVNVDINGGSPMALNDTTKAFVSLSQYCTSSSSSTDISPKDAWVHVDFLDSSTLTFSRYNNYMQLFIEWWVVESADLYVEHMSYSRSDAWNGGETITVPAPLYFKKLRHSFLLTSQKSSMGYQDPQSLVFSQHTAASNLISYVDVRRGNTFSVARDSVAHLQVIYSEYLNVHHADLVQPGITGESSRTLPAFSYDPEYTCLATPSSICIHSSTPQYPPDNVGVAEFICQRWRLSPPIYFTWEGPGFLDSDPVKYYSNRAYIQTVQFTPEGVPLVPARSLVVT